VRLEPVFDGGEIRSIRVWAPVRTKSLRYNEVSAAHYRLAFHALKSALSSADGRSSNVSVADATELRDLGVLIYPDGVSEPVTFEIPAAGPLAGCSSPSFPLQARRNDLDGFADASSYRDRVIWHQPHALAVINPWSTSEELHRSRVDVDEPPEDAVAAAEDAAQHFAAHGYATVRLDLPPPQLTALQRYYERLIVNGWLSWQDEQSARFFGHNDPVAVMLGWRIVPLVQWIARAKIMLSYAYAIRYVRGAALPKHIDREQCKYTVALLLDLDGAEETGVSPWPLTLHPNGSRVDIHQTVGQALIYFGQTIPHSRAPLDTCRSSTSLLLHYVDEDFTGTLI
jgi:hypothetical protein